MAPIINMITPKKLLRYLYDHIDKDKIEIDTINFSGPKFEEC